MKTMQLNRFALLTLTAVIIFASPAKAGGLKSIAYVTRVYDKVLARRPDKSAFSWVQTLNKSGHKAVVDGICYSQENKTKEINSVYQAYLGRAADIDGLAGFSKVFGTKNDWLSIHLGVILSGEFQAKNNCSKMISKLYSVALGRTATTADIAGWSAYCKDPRGIATGILMSTESTNKRVRDLYQRFLERDADPAGLSSFAGLIQSGAPLFAVYSNFLLSSEFVNARLFDGFLFNGKLNLHEKGLIESDVLLNWLGQAEREF